MFFRREKLRVPQFSERIEGLKKYGFGTRNEGGHVMVTRNGIGAILTDGPENRPVVDRIGLVMGSEVGELVNAGYQQLWLAPSKKRAPALALQLKELHAFEEDLKEGLGLTSLYNTSLGTISALHLYDRVADRDDAVHQPRPWEAPR